MWITPAKSASHPASIDVPPMRSRYIPLLPRVIDPRGLGARRFARLRRGTMFSFVRIPTLVIGRVGFLAMSSVCEASSTRGTIKLLKAAVQTSAFGNRFIETEQKI
jgi:hypothetical protein